MKEKSNQISCPICKNIIFKRGLFGHLRMAHEKTSEEAHEYMSTQVHESLPEKTSKKARHDMSTQVHENMSTQVHESLSDKTSDELKKEIAENKEAMTDLENKTAKEPVKKEIISDIPIHTVKPHIPTHMDCPFCEERRKIRGIKRHIALSHNVPGITFQDLDDVEKGLKSLPDLVSEKFEGEAMIANLSPEISEKEFSNWSNIEERPEDLEDPENQEIPEDLESKENGESMAGPIVALGTIAAVIISRDPQIKEIFVKFFDKIKRLGSKKSMDSGKSYGQHAQDLYNGKKL